MTKPTNALEWYQQKYCDHCKNKPCLKKPSGPGGAIYTTSGDFSGKIFCALAALQMLDLDRPVLKEFTKQ
jgi:hypothetical protein